MLDWASETGWAFLITVLFAAAPIVVLFSRDSDQDATAESDAS